MHRSILTTFIRTASTTSSSTSHLKKIEFKLDPKLNPAPSSTSGTYTFPVRNPATGQIITHVDGFSSAQIESTIQAAHKAQQEWQNTTAVERADLMRKWAKSLLDHGEYLAQLMTSEMGKPLPESRAEVNYGTAFISWFAEEGLRVYGDTLPILNRGERILVTRQAVGLCAAITPWNFPLAMITRKAGAALAAGCAMVVKPAHQTPLTAIAAANLAYQVGIPRDVLPIVPVNEAMTSESGRLLTLSPLIRKISFTGSTPVGKLLLQMASSTVKRASMELGGNAPLIIFEDADLDQAVAGAIASRFRNAGQTCVCANRLFVHESLADVFVDKLQAAVKKLRVGNGLEEGVQVGPLITEKAVKKVERLLSDVRPPISVIVGGKRHELGGLFFQPTVVYNVPDDCVLFQEEIFGPVAAVSSFKDEKEGVTRANSTPYGLVAYIFTKDLSRAMRVGETLEYGMVGINNSLISTAMAPFGGFKESGYGREGSRYGINEYTEIKYWNIKYQV